MAYISKYTGSQIDQKLDQVDTKVDKVSGKQLSTNDYTTAEKNKLSGIAEGANKYILPVAGSSIGGVKSGTDITVDSSGNVSVNDESHKHNDNQINWTSSLSGSISNLDTAVSNLHNANRFAFAKPAGIIVEYTTDSGTTWLDYGASDGTKINLCNGNGNTLYLGGLEASTSKSLDKKLRITLDAINMGVYTLLLKILINVTTNGDTMQLLVEQSTIGSPDVFSTKGTYNVSGWSGWNAIYLNTRFGGSSDQTSQIRRLRLTLYSTKLGDLKYKTPAILDIRAIGSSAWQFPSEMAKSGNLYKYNYEQTALFPKEIIINGATDYGDNYGNSLYKNRVPRGEVVKNYCDANYLSKTGTLDDYIKNTDIATTDKLGIIKPNSSYGTVVSTSGILRLQKASDANIKEKTQEYRPITPSGLDLAVKEGLANNALDWTDDEKANARTKIGALDETTANTLYANKETEDLVKEKSYSKGFDNYQSLVTELNSVAKDKYNVGQSFLIVTLNVPDLWVKSIEETSVPYIYATDEAIITALNTNGTIQFGHYVLSMLETLKQDLTNYVKNTDFGGNSKAGIVKAYIAGGSSISSNGSIMLVKATDSEIIAKTNQYKPIVPSSLNLAVKEGLVNNTLTLTEEEKAKARTFLGANYDDSIEDINTALGNKLDKTGGTITGSLNVDQILRTNKVFNNVATFNDTSTVNEIVIKTKIPFTNGNAMPLVHLKGYAFGESSPIELTIAFYVYNNAFCYAGATSTCPWKPDIYLATYTENNQKYAAICLSKSIYYCKFVVDLMDIWINSTTRDYASGWTILSKASTTSGTIIPTDDKVKVSYKSIANDISGKAANSDKLNGQSASYYLNYSNLSNKPTIPTVTNDLTNALKANYDSAYTHSTSTHARTDATKTEASSINGKIKINGTDTAVYTHPTTTAVTPGYYKIGKDSLGHVIVGDAFTPGSGGDIDVKLCKHNIILTDGGSGARVFFSITNNKEDEYTSSSLFMMSSGRKYIKFIPCYDQDYGSNRFIRECEYDPDAEGVYIYFVDEDSRYIYYNDIVIEDSITIDHIASTVPDGNEVNF